MDLGSSHSSSHEVASKVASITECSKVALDHNLAVVEREQDAVRFE
jgi:hypothetical protein